VGLHGILTIVCPDRTGIVAAISSFLAENGANILDSQQYSEEADCTFFMRIVFDADGMSLPRTEIEKAFGVVGERFSMRWRLRFSDDVPAMGIMVSRFEHCLVDLLARYRIGELPVRIPLIVSNHPDLEPIATGFGIPYTVVPVTPGTKPQDERQQIHLLREAGCDFVVLARYMQVLSPAFLEAFPSSIITASSQRSPERAHTIRRTSAGSS
jgi:formyltetrahydrofolate deformylase